MKFIPCNTDAWTEAEKKAKRKVKKPVAKVKKRGYSPKVHKNLNAR